MLLLYCRRVALAFGFLVILAAYSLAQAEKCVEPISSAPALRGAKLRMSSTEITKLWGINRPPRAIATGLSMEDVRKMPYFKEKVGNDGVLDEILKEKVTDSKTAGMDLSYFNADIGQAVLNIGKSDEATGPGKPLEGVSTAWINFYQDKAVDITYIYATDKFNGLTNRDMGDLLANLLGLSAEKWMSMEGVPILFMNCGSFVVNATRVDKSSILSITLKDTVVHEQMKRESERFLIDLYEKARKKKLEAAGKGFKP